MDTVIGSRNALLSTYLLTYYYGLNVERQRELAVNTTYSTVCVCFADRHQIQRVVQCQFDVVQLVRHHVSTIVTGHSVQPRTATHAVHKSSTRPQFYEQLTNNRCHSAPAVKYCQQRDCMSVCLSVCMSARIYQKRHVQISPIFLYKCHVACGRDPVLV